MKKSFFAKTVSVFLALTVLFLTVPAVLIVTNAVTPYWTDAGNFDDTWYDDSAPLTAYTLSTEAELAGLARLVYDGETFSGVTFTLDADLDLSTGGYNWLPIGTFDGLFDGIFDGDGHIITGMTMVEASIIKDSCYGLFGYIGEHAEISNINIEAMEIDLSSTKELYVGAIAGNAAVTAAISGCTVDGTGVFAVESIEEIYAGGIVGYGTSTEISGCANASGITVTALGTSTDAFVGGIVGYGSNISASSNSGAITFDGSAVTGDDEMYIGGLAGYMDASLTNVPVYSYNEGNITASVVKGGYIGGLAGNGFAESSYNTGDVAVSGTGTGEIYTGGLFGLCSAASSLCYNTGAVSVVTSVENILFTGGISGDNLAALLSCYNTGAITVDGYDKVYIGGISGFNLMSVTGCYNTASVTVTSTGDDEYTGAVLGTSDSSATYADNYYYGPREIKGVGRRDDTADMFRFVALDKFLITLLSNEINILELDSTALTALTDTGAAVTYETTAYDVTPAGCGTIFSLVLTGVTPGDAVLGGEFTIGNIDIADGVDPGLLASGFAGTPGDTVVTVSEAYTLLSNDPVITTDPAAAHTIVPGGTGNALTVVAADPNGLALTYQWQLEDSASPGTWNDITGAIGTSYSPTSAGNYRVAVSNGAESVNSAVSVVSLTKGAPASVVLSLVESSGSSPVSFLLTAAVTPQTGFPVTAGEMVFFYMDGVKIGDATVDASGIAEFTVLIAPLGDDPHTFRADYQGNEFYNLTASNGVNYGEPVLTTSLLSNTVTYGDPGFTVTVNGDPAGVTFESSDHGVLYVDADGNVTIIGAGQASLTAVKSGFTSNPVVITVLKKRISAKAVDTDRVYGDDNPRFYVEYTGLVNGDAPEDIDAPPDLHCIATVTSRVGDYLITITGGSDGNYEFENLYEGIMTVTKRELIVIVDNKSRVVNSNNPAFTLSYRGFVLGENESVFNSRPTVETSATRGSAPGRYDIVVYGGSADNYAFTYVYGVLTVLSEDEVPLTGDITMLIPIGAFLMASGLILLVVRHRRRYF